MYRGERSEVEGDRSAVGVRQAGGIPDDFSHGAADEVELRGLSVSQQSLDVLRAPFPDAGFRIRGDIGDHFAAGPGQSAAEQTGGFRSAEPIAGRVTVAAAADYANQIRATVPGCVLCGV